MERMGWELGEKGELGDMERRGWGVGEKGELGDMRVRSGGHGEKGVGSRREGGTWRHEG